MYEIDCLLLIYYNKSNYYNLRLFIFKIIEAPNMTCKIIIDSLSYDLVSL